MKKQARIGDVVEVEWVDSEHIGIGWKKRSEYVRVAVAPQAYRTSGYFIAQVGGHVLICLSIDPRNRRVADITSIPVSAVLTTRLLGRSNKRVRQALKH